MNFIYPGIRITEATVINEGVTPTTHHIRIETKLRIKNKEDGLWYLCLFIKSFGVSELQVTNDKEKNDWRNQCINMFLREVHIAKYHYIVDRNIMTNNGEYLFELDEIQISEDERTRNMMINY